MRCNTDVTLNNILADLENLKFEEEEIGPSICIYFVLFFYL